ncbi:alpha/beta hydrolase fold domain-containing protein [Streptomyces goshikiensis]|uniref:alpha/beta hydrolase fold domain-containing protein n=1 Tax=Streptomyces goshikiensis TaxID=1942 RepID=UPI00381DFB71
MTEAPTPAPTAPAPGPARLDPAARPHVDALAAAFPDLGGAVTDAAQARRILAAAPGSAAPPPAVGSVEDREVPGPDGAPPVPVRVYRPDPGRWPGPRPTAVFCRGGGCVLCDLDSHDRTVRALCRASGAVVVSVGCRRAPESRFPAAVLDAYAALRWAAGRVAEPGGDPAALVVAGDSAGGNLTAGSALLARGRGGPALALQVLIYPCLDAAQDTASYRTRGGRVRPGPARGGYGGGARPPPRDVPRFPRAGRRTAPGPPSRAATRRSDQFHSKRREDFRRSGGYHRIISRVTS